MAEAKTQDPLQKWDPKPRTLQIGPDTQDPGLLSNAGPKT